MTPPINNAAYYSVVVTEAEGGTTTVVFDGGGEPSPKLELQAASASMARLSAVAMIFLYVISDFLPEC